MRALALSLLLATPALAEVPTITIDKGYEGIGYSLSSSGNIEVYAAPRQASGMLAICGFVMTLKSNATTRMVEKKASANIAFWLGNTPLHVNTLVFKRYKTEEELKASPLAGCDVTQTPWNPAFAKTKLRMEMSSGTVRF